MFIVRNIKTVDEQTYTVDYSFCDTRFRLGRQNTGDYQINIY